MIEPHATSASRGTATAPRPATASPDRFSALMQLAQRGDRGAYTRLLKDVAPLLRGMARRKAPFLDAADIEDLVQETLMSVHLARATYDAERPFMPWLHALLSNRMVDAARRYGRRAAHEVQTEDFELACAGVADRDATESYRDPQLLMREIRNLPKGQRIAIELLKLQELSLEQAAAKTGMSIGALKVATHRALGALRKRLGGPVGESLPAAVRAKG